MFYKDPLNIYRAQPLDQFDWLMHGFGTRAFRNFAGNGNLATLRQIHSAICILAEGRTGCLGEGDALLENTPGRLVGVKTADCLPILLVDPRNRAVAAVHAGWRGTLLRIGPKAVETMQEKFSTRPEDLHAAIGPGIGKCCYQVGPEVAAQFGQTGPAKIDLVEANRRQLVESGIPSQRIFAACLCTMCETNDFHSWRRDKDRAGRMLSFVGLR